MIEIRAIQAEDTYEIRQKVMWPHKNIEFIKVEDDKEGFHLGLFENDALMSVVSVFYKNQEAQFRKFATLTASQGKGYGTKLLDFIFQEMRKKDVQRIWCNARRNKAAFYTKFGMKTTDVFFTKEGVDYVVMEKESSF